MLIVDGDLLTGDCAASQWSCRWLTTQKDYHNYDSNGMDMRHDSAGISRMRAKYAQHSGSSENEQHGVVWHVLATSASSMEAHVVSMAPSADFEVYVATHGYVDNESRKGGVCRMRHRLPVGFEEPQ